MLKVQNILAVILLLSSTIVQSQEVEFNVSAPSVVAQGEQFRLTYTLNARPQEFNPPSFGNFYILAGPSTSSSSSVEIINGKMSQTFNYSYTYILEATTEGRFTIEPARVVVNKKEYTTQPIEIEVVKGTSQQSRSGQTAQPGGQEVTAASTEDMFVAIEFDKNNIYRGQAVLATIKLYTRSNISGFEDIKFPSFTGFWNQEVETPSNVNFQRVNLDGKIYNMGVLKKYLLFPQRSGDITIEPFQIVVLTPQRSGRSQSIFDEFFGAYQTVRKRLTSKPLTLKVKDLPANAPQSFSGAVGRFSLDAKLDKQQLKTNEAINIQVRIAGSGNLRLIETPKITFPGGFEAFDPKVTDNISTTQQGSTGAKTFDFVAIPRTPGNFDLGQVEFTYFDPTQEKYVTLKSKPLSVKVDADGTEPGTIQVVGFGKEDVRFIGKDIRFIKTENVRLVLNPLTLFGSKLFVVIIIILIVGFVFAFLAISRLRKLKGNVALVKTRKANKVARKRLKEARNYLQQDNNEKFYEELLRAMWGYVSDKLSIPLANLSSESVRETLISHNAPDDSVNSFNEIVSTCEYARYAPKSEHSQMADIYEKAHSLISALESVIRK